MTIIAFVVVMIVAMQTCRVTETRQHSHTHGQQLIGCISNNQAKMQYLYLSKSYVTVLISTLLAWYTM